MISAESVGGILALGVGELLNRRNRVLVQHFLPALQLAGGPVAVSALDHGGAVLGHLGQQLGDQRRLRVVRIDQYRQFAIFHAWFP
ncbi:hypothetical protein JOS77_11470 [Chromobacterium haemolyticum]|nr:hypothetical protein JOS77_11470 [Chromobacterium haemolyticum]